MAGGQTAARSAFPDWRFAPNIGNSPDVYEIENQALDRGGHVLDAMRALAPWAGRTLVDLGCGTGFWLPQYATEASRVIGVEPDSVLRARAQARAGGLPGVEVVAGSAEHLGRPARSVDVVHARFAYFFPPGADAGLAEVLRVLRPGGTLVVVDNDYRWGDFATLLAAAAPAGSPSRDKAASTDAWWRERGAVRREVRSGWTFDRRSDLEAVLNIEFPAAVARAWLTRNPAATGLSYGYVLFAVSAPALG
jgi:SAM-dependent methyltransferase